MGTETTEKEQIKFSFSFIIKIRFSEIFVNMGQVLGMTPKEEENHHRIHLKRLFT